MAKLIVIDGLDGCGKATQTELLAHSLEKLGKKVVKINFPKYNSDSSAPVRMYLNGELGEHPELLNPYMCSSFFAVDRFIQYITELNKYFEEDNNTFILADRYISANIIHQGGKIEDPDKRESFIKWIYDYECGLCGLPEETITLILMVKPEVSQKLMTERYAGDESKKDIHENDLDYLTKCYERLNSSIEIVNKEGHNWEKIECADETGKLLSREAVHESIMQTLDAFGIW